MLIYVFFLSLGSSNVGEINAPIQRINTQVRGYLSLKTVISMITGALFGITLWLFGVPMSLTFGVLAFLLNFIPNTGPIVATLLPIPLILLHPDGTIVWMIAAIGTTSAIQVLSGNVVEPNLMGQSSDLHPVVILLALMFWGSGGSCWACRLRFTFFWVVILDSPIPGIYEPAGSHQQYQATELTNPTDGQI